IKIQIETKLWKRFQCKGEENAIFLFIAGVVSDDCAKGGDPVRQISVDGVALFLENADCAFVLLLKSETPVVTYSIIAADHKETAMLEERVVVEITMTEVEL